jgi:hypothetical protein
LSLSPPALAAEPSDIESNITITVDGAQKQVSLAEAMAALNIPAASIALIDKDQIALARAYGDGVTPNTLFQAASLSKFVTAVGALRLVDQKRLRSTLTRTQPRARDRCATLRAADFRRRSDLSPPRGRARKAAAARRCYAPSRPALTRARPFLRGRACAACRPRGQNVGYQGYLILLPAEGQGLVVMTNSDNGSILAEALIRRAAQLYGWPPFGPLPD